MTLTVLPENSQFVIDNDLGIIIPVSTTAPGNGRYLPHPLDDPNRSFMTTGKAAVFQKGLGVVLLHDDETGIAFWPAYASGTDDFLMRALVQGYMANTGPTPVVMTMLSTIVAKRQGMAGTWLTVAHGRKTPVKKFLDLMSMADDSEFGPAEFVRSYIGSLDVDNRGAIGAQVPIGSIGFDKWGEYGMTAVPIPGLNERGKPPRMFSLEMTPEVFQENRGLWMLDGLDCYPTGNKEYPYWIRKHSRQLKGDVFVLIHRDFGFQILQQAGAKNSLYAGYGQSGTWRISPYLVKHLAIDRMDMEHLLAQPPRGIILASGLDTATQFRDEFETYKQERSDNDQLLYPGVFFIGTKATDSKVTMVPWTEPPAGYTPQEWTNELVSNLAAAFHMNETQLRLRLGEGALTQSGVAESLEAETSIAWMRHTIETIWNRIAPPRVLVTVIWHSDRTRRFQIESFRELSLGISRVNKPNPNAEGSEAERLVFSRAEIRALTENYIGIPIPETGEEDIETASDREDVDDVAQSLGRFFTLRQALIPLCESGLPNNVKFAQGNRIILRNTYQTGQITGWSGRGTWVWLRLDGDRWEMLMDASKVTLLELGENGRLAQQGCSCNHHNDLTSSGSAPKPTYRLGERILTVSGTPGTIVNIESQDGEQTAVYLKFDWDLLSMNGRRYPIDQIRLAEFAPEGDPLPPPTEVDLDRKKAMSDARRIWRATAPEDRKDLL